MAAPVEKKMPVSLAHVAEASGVSVATASRVLNGLGGMSDRTAAHVRRLAGQLGYTPLRTRRPAGVKPAPVGTGNLAIVVLGRTSDWLHLPVMVSAVDGVRAASEASGYRLILTQVVDPALPGTLFDNREIEGAIVFVSSTFDRARVADAMRELHQRLPVVWAMGGPLAVDVDHVLPNHLRVGQLAYEYLAGQGCRELAFVCTSPQWPLMRARAHGFLDAAGDAGAAGRAYVVTDAAALAATYGGDVVYAPDAPALVARLAEAMPRPQGLFIGNDFMTAELYPLLKRAGLRPGRDVTIVSCDHEEARLTALDPRPASIDVGANQIGRRAVAQLLNRMQHPDESPVSIDITPRLTAASG